MNYQKAYDSMIQNRLANPLPEGMYCEKHHIKPRSLGGSNAKSNIVGLTPREHFLAHRCLAKVHGGKMWAALAYMSRGATKSAKGVKISSRLYDMIKRKDAEWRSVAYAGENNYWYQKKLPEYVREKMRGPRPNSSGENHPNFGISNKERNLLISYIKTANNKKDIVNYNTLNRINLITGVPEYFDENGKKRHRMNPELVKIKKSLLFKFHRQEVMCGENNPNYNNGDKIRGEKNPMFGRVHSPETLLKMSEKAKQRRTIVCPKCQKQGSVGNMNRWHFDNCKAA